MAAVLACGPGAVLSHRSAAALHGLRRTDQANIDITVPSRSTRTHVGIDLHRSTTLTPVDVTPLNGIPCTTIARTFLDLAGVLARRPVERALDQAEVAGVLNLRALEEQLDRNRMHPGTRPLRSILREHHIGRTATWSELEERFLMVLRERGLPEPEVNAWIVLDDGKPAVRVDFVWRDERVVVETDGRGFHQTSQAFENDRRRDQRLTVAGWRVIRVTWRQLVGEPEAVVRTLAALLQL